MKPRVYVTRNGGFRCDPREVMQWILATKGGRIVPDRHQTVPRATNKYHFLPAWARIIAITLGLLLSACAKVEPQSPKPIITHVLLDTAFVQYFSNARNRQYDHKTLPDEEIVSCAYGVIRNDTALVAFIRPTFSQPLGSSMVAYHPCKSINPEIGGQIRLLGTWHNHNPDTLREGGCYFSSLDDNAFAETENIIELVTCKDRTIWRSKKK